MSVGDVLDIEISLVSTNSRDFLRACLLSLPAACDGLEWGVTVVDNASTDGTFEMLADEFPSVHVLRNSVPLGFSANHNQVLGPALAGGTRYGVILNEDTELDPGAIADLVRFCDANPRVGAAGPTIVGTDGAIQESLFPLPTVAGELAACLRPGRPRPRASDGQGWLNGSCVLVRFAALREIGLLDDRFFIFFEDTDLGARLLDAGWSSAVSSTSRMLHHGHQVVSQPTYGSRMERQMIRSRYLYFRKHDRAASAEVLRVAARGAFALRAAKTAFSGRLRGGDDERALAELLWSLASYDPRTVLQHEELARASAPGTLPGKADGRDPAHRLGANSS